ncbi:hypothetical protein [Microcoleus sp.]|uniref:hypothetical protein n=1 Tax=Microcoleus sp. TaxID=44472 RepID=UPI003592EFFC
MPIFTTNKLNSSNLLKAEIVFLGSSPFGKKRFFAVRASDIASLASDRTIKAKVRLFFFVSRAIDPYTKSLHKFSICAFVYLTAEVTKAPGRFRKQQLFPVKADLPTHPKR